MKHLSSIVAAAACTASSALPALGQIQPAPYQGTLRSAGTLVNGPADFQLRLFSSPAGSVQVGPTQDLSGVSVIEGRFTVPIDFGPGVFDGEDRYLEIAVRAPAGAGNFVILTPRHRIDAVPHANHVLGVDGRSLDAADGSPVDALVVDGTGGVGIGSSPSGRFEVHSGNSSYLRVGNLQGDLHVNGGSDRVAGIWNDSIGFDARTDIIVNNWPQMVINAGGGVGIGTLTPPRRLTVADSNLWTARFEGSHPMSAIVEFSNTASNASWHLNARGTDDLIDGALVFREQNQSFQSLRIMPNSWIGLGVGSPAFRLELENIANPDGRARANAWVTFSSARWKDNVHTLDVALDTVMRLRGVSFDWKPEHGGQPDIGFVAEEVGKVVPELVSWEKDGPHAQGLAYDRVTALAVEAIKQQQRTLESLRRENAELGQLVDRLDRVLTAAEAGTGRAAR